MSIPLSSDIAFTDFLKRVEKFGLRVWLEIPYRPEGYNAAVEYDQETDRLLAQIRGAA